MTEAAAKQPGLPLPVTLTLTGTVPTFSNTTYQEVLRMKPVAASFLFSVLLVVIGAIVGIGCTDADRSKLGGYGDSFYVAQYSGGVCVSEWISTGKVHSEDGSDGYYFKDKRSGRLIEVSGDVIIVRLEPNEVVLLEPTIHPIEILEPLTLR